MSVGHLARILEERGIATVVLMIGAFAHHARQMMLPRTLVTPNPMGRPVGPPGDAAAQRRAVTAALRMVDEVASPAEMLILEEPYRPSRQAGESP